MSLELHKSGIYKILNRSTGKFYVGSAIDLRRRWIDGHRSLLNRNKHQNRYLQAAWNKYGSDDFEFIVLEIIENGDLLLAREQYWLDATQCCDRTVGYNLYLYAGGGPKGGPLTLEHRQKIAAAGRGRKWSEETREKMRTAQDRSNPERCRKISLSKIGHLTSSETREKMSITRRRADSPYAGLPYPHGAMCRCQLCRNVRSRYEWLRRLKNKEEKS